MLKSRTWFTDNTEVLTTRGWIRIDRMNRIHEVVVVKNDVIVGENLTEYNRAQYKGPIDYYKFKDVFYTAKNLLLPEGKIWRIDNYLEVDTTKIEKRLFEGYIYNLVTPSNTLITRTYTHEFHNNNDYILSLCVAK